jgi:hypothetical protein
MQKMKPLMKKVIIYIQSVSGNASIIIQVIDSFISIKTVSEYPCDK